MFMTNALDYFILAHNQFIWHKVIDIIIGRPAYDNYLVALALKNGLSVIDATETILTVHQTGKEGNKAGFRNRDANYNYRLLRKFNRKRGHTIYAPYYTKHGRKERDIELQLRSAKEMVKLSRLLRRRFH